MAKQMSIPAMIRRAQKVFNAYICKRDADKRCISCNGKVEQAGHFYSAGQHSALRFNEDNCHGQCIRCNYYKHGNLSEYRIRLEQKIGKGNLMILDYAASSTKVKRWTRTELEAIYQYYKNKKI